MNSERGVTTTLGVLAVGRPDLLEVIAPCLPYVDHFMPSLEEAVMISGRSERSDVIRFFLDLGVGHTVFKMCAQGGTIASRDGGEIRIPAYAVQMVDSTGCGDAYCAGFIMGLSLGWSLEEAGRLGSASGSLVATGPGSDAGIVDLDHTMEFMRSTPTLPLEG